MRDQRRRAAARVGSRLGGALAVVGWPAALSAHPLAEHAAEAGGGWALEVGPTVATLALAAAYALGVRRLWARAGRGRGVRPAHARAFAAAAVVLLAALASPFDAVADALFSAHMVQHLLLILVAAPLLALANVPLALAWAPPLATRRALARWWNGLGRAPRAFRALGHAAATPAAAWLLHAAALVLWHVPAPYEAALRHPAVHALEHASFVGTAWLFWWRVVRWHRRSPAAAIPYIMSMGVLGSAMGALLAFSRSPWYPAHAAGARAWHTTLLADQQLAGLVMWVPAGLVYLGAALAVAARWMLGEGRAAPRAAARALGAAGAAAVLVLVTGGCGRDGRRTASGDDGPARNAPVRTAAIATAPDGTAGDLAALGVGREAPDPERGARAIHSYGCGSCHTIPGVRGADGMVGPPLAGWAHRTVVAGYLPNTPEQLVRWIVLPQSVAPGNAMPNLGVTDRDARDIAAYLYSLH